MTKFSLGDDCQALGLAQGVTHGCFVWGDSRFRQVLDSISVQVDCHLWTSHGTGLLRQLPQQTCFMACPQVTITQYAAHGLALHTKVASEDGLHAVSPVYKAGT